LLGARVGVIRAAAAGQISLSASLSAVHQIHDLLVLYYYNLKEVFLGIVFKPLSAITETIISGLDMSRYLKRKPGPPRA
jgi:hypothetical protein